jgi:hypothetical protein
MTGTYSTDVAASLAQHIPLKVGGVYTADAAARRPEL